MNEMILGLIEHGVRNRITKTESNGRQFDYLIIPRGKVKYFPFPQRFYSDRRVDPMLIIWTHKDGNYYTWYEFICGDMAGRMRTHFDHDINEMSYYINKYFPTEIGQFNQDQMNAILDGTYYNVHDSFIDLYGDEKYLFFTYRDKFDGKRYRRVTKGFDWYFYIRERDYQRAWEILRQTGLNKKVKGTEREGRWIKIYAEFISNIEWHDRTDAARDIVKALRVGGVETFEGDLDAAKRYTIDNELKIETDLKVLYYDIETDDSNDRIIVGGDQILSIGAVDRDGREYWKCTNNEKNLLEDFTTYIKNYDIVVGYNNWNFDDEYVMQRCREYHNYFSFHHRNWRIGRVDMMKRIIGTFARLKAGELTSFKLENVGQYFLGRGKIKHGRKIKDLFDNDRKMLREYNMEDCFLVKDLDHDMGVVDLMVAMCQATGAFPTTLRPSKNTAGLSVSPLLDMFILRKAKSYNIHYPTITWTKTEGQFEGAYIMEPEIGMFNDVYILDFKSLYPSIIWSWRISPENRKLTKFKTKHPVITTANGIQFYKDGTAIFPLLVEELMQMRKNYKNEMFKCEVDSVPYKKNDIMQQVAKELNNSLYGQLGQNGGRYFDWDTAEAVTIGGQYLLKKTAEICEGMGVKVIYGDTDSVFITGLPTDQSPHEYVKKINDEILNVLQTEFNIDKSLVEIEYEKKMSKFILLMKKNYTGLMSELDGKPIDKIMYKGIECIKRSTIDIAKRLQKELIDSLLRTNYPLGYYTAWIERQKAEFYEGRVNIEELIQKTSISKMPHEYKKKAKPVKNPDQVTMEEMLNEYDIENECANDENPIDKMLPHVKVAQWLIDNEMEFYVGMQVPFIIVDQDRKKVIHASQYAGEYDKDYYWQRTFKPLARVLKACYPAVDWDRYDEIEMRKRMGRKHYIPIGQVGFDFVSGITPKKTGRFVIKKTDDNKLF